MSYNSFADEAIIDEGSGLLGEIIVLRSPHRDTYREDNKLAIVKAEELFQRYPNTQSAVYAFKQVYWWLTDDQYCTASPYNPSQQLEKYLGLIISAPDTLLGKTVKRMLCLRLLLGHRYPWKDLEHHISIVDDVTVKHMLIVGIANSYYSQEKRFQKALEYYKRFLKEATQDIHIIVYEETSIINTVHAQAQAYYRLAETLIQLEEYTEAIKTLNELSKIYPQENIFPEWCGDITSTYECREGQAGGFAGILTAEIWGTYLHNKQKALEVYRETFKQFSGEPYQAFESVADFGLLVINTVHRTNIFSASEKIRFLQNIENDSKAQVNTVVAFLTIATLYQQENQFKEALEIYEQLFHQYHSVYFPSYHGKWSVGIELLRLAKKASQQYDNGITYQKLRDTVTHMEKNVDEHVLEYLENEGMNR